MKINSKIDAFTIIEVTVSMLLAAISIAIAYTSYRVVSNSYRQFDSKNKKVSEFVLTDKLLKKDVSSCSRIARTEQGIDITVPDGVISYSFTSGYILREHSGLRMDTLFVQPTRLETFFEQGEVREGELIDKLTFDVTLEGEITSLAYIKNYSAEELFK